MDMERLSPVMTLLIKNVGKKFNMKNASAVNLGKLSAKSRLGGMTKKQKAEAMKAVWLKSLKARGIKSKHLTVNA